MTSWAEARDLALALPEVEEKDHFGSPSFRIGGKIFAQLSAGAEGGGSALVKLPMADQTALALMDPQTFSPEPNWGHHGWTRIALAGVDPATLGRLLAQSLSRVARPARQSSRSKS